MIHGKTTLGKESRSLIWLSLFAAPIGFGYAQMVWTLIRHLAAMGSAVFGGLTVFAS